ncbi:DEAD/DEAH box helicase [archaeon]|jgi:ERCC4-related helicase|nr:DEAD/DEAH box helicase [archaeon]MBT3730993.1 DEAD/DEAH box helicase [archaeon]MBT4669769.1 DEAD/DEAH box helicase [archaeon]MBT5029919.1 DEAD/DEAH box helicase [archaeon]MBT5288491.1 DEAD/DEAH box helicase [archaeon]
MFQIKGFEPRLYQESIFKTTMKANTLICLPTGRGKTKVALLSALHRLNSFPKSKIIFLTPTKPLAKQIADEFKDSSTLEKVEIFTGLIKPEKREEMFKDNDVIVSTPQGMSNDIINKKVDLRNVSLIVFDECHRAVGDYDYVWIAKQYNKVANFPRIIGLSASPGSDQEKINEICSNLFIEDIEIRTDKDDDLKEYVKETKVKYEVIELPENFKEAKKYLENCFKEKLTILKEFGLTKTISNVHKTALLGMQREIQRKISMGEKDPMTWKSISIVAEAMKVQHAQEMLESQGIYAAFEYMNKLYKEAENGKVKATKNLVVDTNFKMAFMKVNNMHSLGVEHPKLIRLREIIKEEKRDKILIFTNFRASAQKLKKELNKIEGIKAEMFIGQTKKKGIGLTQKEQIKVLEDFKAGEFNVLIGTSVGEEGIDIPSVELIIFYEPVPSAIRTVQRRGRTGRLEDGEVIVLVAKGTRDEAYRWTAYHKENRMHRVLKGMKTKFNLGNSQETTLNDFKDKKKWKMFVDSREKGSGIARFLVDKDVDVTMQNLDVGDFIVSERVGIERKEIRDFVDSIVDKRVLHQLKSLKDTFERPILIIEGIEDIYSVRKVHPNAIRGMLAWIAVDLKIPIIYTKDFRDTGEFLITLAKREQEENEKEFGVRGEKKPLSTKELQEYIVSGLPGVGPSLAKNLLKEFVTVKKIINASEDELKDVDKIGKKKASEIRKVLEEKYKE